MRIITPTCESGSLAVGPRVKRYERLFGRWPVLLFFGKGRTGRNPKNSPSDIRAPSVGSF